MKAVVARSVLALALGTLACGCSIAIKGGGHSYNDGKVEDLREPPAIAVSELEAGVREFREGQIDLAVAADFVDSLPGTEFNDFRLTSRYRFRGPQRLSPWVGGGVGWYRLFTRRQVLVPSVYCTNFLPQSTCVASEAFTLSSGFFPHLSLGVGLDVSKSVELVLEDRFDFAKDEGAVDFGSNQVMVGFRARLGR